MAVHAAKLRSGRVGAISKVNRTQSFVDSTCRALITHFLTFKIVPQLLFYTWQQMHYPTVYIFTGVEDTGLRENFCPHSHCGPHTRGGH